MGENDYERMQAQIDAWLLQTSWASFECAAAEKQNAFVEYSQLLVRIAPNASPVFLL